jgi:putative transposase
MQNNPLKTILEFIAKDQIEPALLAQIDYLKAENRILSAEVQTKNLNDSQRKILAELAIKIRTISKAVFEDSVNIVKPETILKWHRKLVAQKFDGTKNRKSLKRITKEIELQIVEMAQNNLTAGYGKIQGYLDDLGISYSKTTIKNILIKHGLQPAPQRKYDLTWKQFIKTHVDIMWGCDFFTHEVWSRQGLITYYILVFIHLGTRRLEIVNLTQNPTAEWTVQQARNFFYNIDTIPEKANMKYLLHDKGPQFNEAFDNLISSTTNELGQKISPKTTTCAQMNGHCERVIQSIQTECLDNFICMGERMLRYALKEYQNFYNNERHHQGIDNLIPLATPKAIQPIGKVKYKEKLGGLLKKYYRQTA